MTKNVCRIILSNIRFYTLGFLSDVFLFSDRFLLDIIDSRFHVARIRRRFRRSVDCVLILSQTMFVIIDES